MKSSPRLIWLKPAALLALFALIAYAPAPHSAAQNTQDRQLARTSGQNPNQKSQRLALVIGNGTYQSSKLKNPPNDATAVAGALRGLGFEVTSGVNKSQREMKQMIRDFGQRLRSNGGVGLFYFAGHGVQAKGRNYLIPVDADIQAEADLEDQAVDLNYLLNFLDDAQNSLNIVILDACRNNPFARSFRSAQGGLAQVRAPSGTLIAYATAPDSTAADGDTANSPYAEELMKQLPVPGVLIETMFRRVAEQVSSRTSGKQEPWFSANVKGDFYFNPGTASEADAGTNSAKSPASIADADSEFWLTIRNSTDPDDFRSYLKAFPSGRYVPIAHNSLRRLESAANAARVKTEARPSPKNNPKSAPLISAPRSAAEYVSASRLKDDLSFVADDARQGRDTPSQGLDETARFIVSKLVGWGIKPAGDNSTYYQSIELRRARLNTAQTRVEIGGRGFTLGSGFLATPVSGDVTGSVVYAGHGWVIKSKDIDAYRGIDVRGKVVVVFGSYLPKGVNYADLSSDRQGVDWFSPDIYAARNGALGVIRIPTPQTLANWELSRQRSVGKGSTAVTAFATQNPITEITASPEMLIALFEGEQQSGAEIQQRCANGDPGSPFALHKTVTLKISTDIETLTAQNVIGVLEGSDSATREYVALGAHYDHVGVGAAVNGDSIYNGANDNGSGTVGLLGIAEAFSRSVPTKRSILFIWHVGEEKGLWGSRYFTDHPTIPLNQIVAELTIEMIGRSKKEGDPNPRNQDLSGPNQIYVIGSKMMSTELGELSEAVNKSYLDLQFDYRYDDPNDPNRFFYRSDHYNYARKGIPVIFYFGGVDDEYHRPGDSIDKIDFEKMEKVSRTIFLTAWELANAPHRPRVDHSLPAILAK